MSDDQIAIMYMWKTP